MSELKIIERLMDDLVTRVEALEEKSDEIWVPVKDNWAYFISNKGRVKHYQGRESKIGTDNKGYYRVTLNGKKFFLHRLLAQAFIPNPEGKELIDHRDGDPQNNKLSNLRWCSYSENACNRRISTHSTIGSKGVTFNKPAGKYVARIMVNGRRTHLGYFLTAEEASEAYKAAAKELHGEFYSER